MTTESELLKRSESKCELCSAAENLAVYDIPPESDTSADQCVLLCATCRDPNKNMDSHHPFQQEQNKNMDSHHPFQ